MKKISLFIMAILLAGCVESSSSTSNYDEMKKIVSDTLQTEDGKKALRDVLSDSSFRELLVLEHTEIQTAIEQTLLSDKGKEFWQSALDDAKLKEAFAKSIQKELGSLQKDLLKDASYQEEMIKFFNQPDMQKQLETILKGSTMRKEIEKVVQETIENPLMQSKWAELIRQNSEGGKKEDEKSKDGKGE